MNKQKFEFTSVQTLAVLILAVMALLGNKGQYIAAGILLIWGIAKIFRLFFPYRYRQLLSVPQRMAKKATPPKEEPAEKPAPQKEEQPAPEEAKSPPSPAAAPIEKEAAEPIAVDSPDFEGILLQNICFRITERLQGAFADATWKWCCQNPLQELLKGPVRIQVFGTGAQQFTHADVLMERSGKIRIDMMVISPLKKCMAAVPVQALQKEVQSDPDDLDLDDWYELSASCILRATVDELFSRGYKCAFLGEDGVISVKENDQLVKQGRVEHMPSPMLWPDLLPLFEADDLKAKLEDGLIKLTWND